MGDDLQTVRNCICASASGVRLSHLTDMCSSVSLKSKLKVISSFFSIVALHLKKLMTHTVFTSSGSLTFRRMYLVRVVVERKKIHLS